MLRIPKLPVAVLRRGLHESTVTYLTRILKLPPGRIGNDADAATCGCGGEYWNVVSSSFTFSIDKYVQTKAIARSADTFIFGLEK
jgi:hypothetical protein